MDAIGVSAGVDLDLTLEDLRRILDSYKHTSPIIKIGITKEVQSIGMSLPSIASSPSPSLHPPLSRLLSLPLCFLFSFWTCMFSMQPYRSDQDSTTGECNLL